MSNETDLDWLARNIHKWIGRGQEKVFITDKAHGGAHWIAYPERLGVPFFTKAQWLARRAELQNKPSWGDAPEWAGWLAQDQDGEWKWLAGLPGKYVDCWTAVKIKACCKGLALGDWRDTLEKRPEKTIVDICGEVTQENRYEQIFETFVSVEDANQELSELEMLAKVSHLISDKRHRKQFTPFVSVEDNQEQDMKQDNGWHERGELPPVGVRCVLHAAENNGEEVMFIGVTSDSCPVFETAQKRVFVERGEYKFTPIRSERDVLADLIESHGQMSALIVADAIIAAGFKLEEK